MFHTICINTLVLRLYKGGNSPVRLIQDWLREINIPTVVNSELFFGF